MKTKITSDAGIQAKYNLWLQGLNQAELAERSGIGTATISTWKVRFPKLQQITELIVALGKTPNDLLLDDAVASEAADHGAEAPELVVEISELILEYVRLNDLIGTKKYRPTQDALEMVRKIRVAIEKEKQSGGTHVRKTPSRAAAIQGLKASQLARKQGKTALQTNAAPGTHDIH